jgi:hypothetical protein
MASALSIVVANILNNNLLHNIGTEAANNIIGPRRVKAASDITKMYTQSAPDAIQLSGLAMAPIGVFKRRRKTD